MIYSEERGSEGEADVGGAAGEADIVNLAGLEGGFVRFPNPLRDALLSKKCSFFEHCSKGLWPPSPLLFEHLSYFAGGIF